MPKAKAQGRLYFLIYSAEIRNPTMLVIKKEDDKGVYFFLDPIFGGVRATRCGWIVGLRGVLLTGAFFLAVFLAGFLRETVVFRLAGFLETFLLAGLRLATFRRAGALRDDFFRLFAILL